MSKSLVSAEDFTTLLHNFKIIFLSWCQLFSLNKNLTEFKRIESKTLKKKTHHPLFEYPLCVSYFVLLSAIKMANTVSKQQLACLFEKGVYVIEERTLRPGIILLRSWSRMAAPRRTQRLEVWWLLSGVAAEHRGAWWQLQKHT